MLQQFRGSSSSKGEPLQSLHMVHLDGLTQMPTPGSRLCCPAFMCHMVSDDDAEGPKSMRGVEPQATRRHFLIGELLFSTPPTAFCTRAGMRGPPPPMTGRRW